MHARNGFVLLVSLALGCSAGSGIDGHRDGSLIGVEGGALDAGTVVTRPDAARPDAGPPPPGCDAVETCGNGLDDDCNGEVEDGCPCIPGEQARCFHGRPEVRGIGACTDGVMTCEDGLEFGLWGPCVGDVLPAAEACDAEGADESCDGAANEGCECSPGAPPASCGTEEGACTAGTQECLSDGTLGPCTGGTGPVGEVCNGVDDDCDGEIDEGVMRACGVDTGECSAGVERCNAGRFEGCTARTAMPEVCDGLDNDCDGTVDEDLTRACGSSVGACRPGMQTCSSGSWSLCTGETLPALETCNNADDDCDGAIDEGISRACGSSTGICRPGTQTCAAGSFGTCTGGVPAGTETCDGALDENCNGTVDEGCGCTSGARRSCGTDTGACAVGMQTCDSTGNWGVCTGSVGPTPEICNRIDDDCDGMTDEGGVCPTAPPTVTCPGAITADVLSTVSLAGSGSDPDGGTVTYQWSVTTRPTGSSSQPATATAASTNFYLDASGSYTLQLCVTDDEGERACCSTPITSRPPGQLHVEVSWSTVYGDVDGHLLNVTQSDPNGWFTVNDCYWGNRTPDWAPAGAATNPTLDIDDTDGYGPENTTIASMPASGTYTVGLHYYCSHSIGSGTIGMGDGPTQATVRVYCDGALIATYTNLDLTRTDDWLTVATVTYPGCVGRSVNRRTNGTSILPAAFTAPRHCEISCSSSADCPTGERCVRASGGGPPRNICWL